MGIVFTIRTRTEGRLAPGRRLRVSGPHRRAEGALRCARWSTALTISPSHISHCDCKNCVAQTGEMVTVLRVKEPADRARDHGFGIGGSSPRNGCSSSALMMIRGVTNRNTRAARGRADTRHQAANVGNAAQHRWVGRRLDVDLSRDNDHGLPLRDGAGLFEAERLHAGRWTRRRKFLILLALVGDLDQHRQSPALRLPTRSAGSRP